LHATDNNTSLQGQSPGPFWGHFFVVMPSQTNAAALSHAFSSPGQAAPFLVRHAEKIAFTAACPSIEALPSHLNQPHRPPPSAPQSPPACAPRTSTRPRHPPPSLRLTPRPCLRGAAGAPLPLLLPLAPSALARAASRPSNNPRRSNHGTCRTLAEARASGRGVCVAVGKGTKHRRPA